MGTFAETTLGRAPAGSPLSCQQAKLPAGFKTWVSSSLSRGSGTLGPVPGAFLFDGTSQHTFSDAFSPDEWSILTGVQVTPEEARELELNSRQQARSTCWQEARSDRLTASGFGQVDARDEWAQKVLENLIEPKDLSRVRAVKHGRNNEGSACDRYGSVMKSWGHNVSLQHCGLVVNLSCPWLGASPDRLVYDPEELTYGVLEVKCPYSLRDSEPDFVRSHDFYLTFNENEEPSLNRDHQYYGQVLGQMALTECQWADFVVRSENWIAIERIWFDEEEWLRVKSNLDSFYFTYMLPHLVRRVTS
ncbi:unnamed protein product [Ixodes persulcatus]